VIAIENTRLFDEVQARTKELQESLDRQTATSEVLGVISRSPNEVQPVLDTIVATARRLCQADRAVVWRLEGETFRAVAHRGQPEERVESVLSARMPLSRESMSGRAMLARRTVQVEDVATDPELVAQHAFNLAGNTHTVLAVPLLLKGDPIGVITLSRTRVAPFDDKQIALVEAFADQAVIAIENSRLFEAEQASKRELQESLEYQTATGDVLNVISRSPSDVQPVFDVIAQTAERLCEAEYSMILRRSDDGLYRLAAHSNAAPSFVEWRKDNPMRPGDGSAVGIVLMEKVTIHIPDLLADARFTDFRGQQQAQARTVLGVPLMRVDEVIGVVFLARRHVKPFTNKQIELVTTFADQAVIAIENARLFEAEQASKRELAEALEQQTATADVLKVISRSALDVQKVLDALVESAARLCNAQDAAIFQVIGDGLRVVAHHGHIPVLEHSIPLVRGNITGRIVIDRRTIQIADMLAEVEYPESRRRALKSGFRTALGVPLVHADEVIGVIFIRRTEVRPFTERQIELVNTFADQAVIAIENTRLFEEVQARTRELTESLQQQTGTADVLKVISRSAFDLKSVLQALVESAARLCDADKGTITRQIDGVFYRAESYGFSAEVMERWRNVPVTPERSSAAGRALLEGRAVHVPDADADPDYTFDTAGARTMLGVPMLREGAPIGVLALARSDVRPFTDKQIDLVSTFADQAAIAIENVRLFEEVQARTSELAKTVEDLEIASQHKNQFVANMSHELRTPLAAILGYAELIQESFYEPQGPKSLDALTRIRSNGKHLLGLINTVLDIAKIESGQFTLNMSEYAIESVVDTVRSATESLAQNKKLALKTEVAKSLPVGLGDEQRLTQVLLNLVGNAIKFTDTGEVRVTAKAVDGHFNICVTDTGPGIPKEHQTRIFEQFHQIDNSNTKAKGGTGLGLAIAKQIVEMHGGRIWVESTVGKGSTFQMEIPARAQVAKSA
jgi:signal transduction histidine kinase